MGGFVFTGSGDTDPLHVEALSFEMGFVFIGTALRS